MFDGDYDRLSALGEEQSRRLGDYLANLGVRFDEVYTGPQKRQRDTAQIVAESYLRAGLRLPEAAVLDDLREYDGDGIVNHLLPIAAATDEKVRRLAEDYERSRGGADRYRSFQRMFESIALRWVSGEVSSERVESWRSFHDRVRGALEGLTAIEGSGRRVIVFTSGGPTSVAVQIATRAPERMAIEFNWRVRNSSITEIVFSRERFSLDVFNALPHLTDPNMWTYR
jgi:broad specificity phosphatase PhoE